MSEKFHYGLQLCKKQPYTLLAILLIPAVLSELPYFGQDDYAIFFGPLGIAVSFLGFIIAAIGMGAFIHAIDALAHQEHATVQSAYAAAFKKAGSLILWYFVVMIVVVGFIMTEMVLALVSFRYHEV